MKKKLNILFDLIAFNSKKILLFIIFILKFVHLFEMFMDTEEIRIIHDALESMQSETFQYQPILRQQPASMSMVPLLVGNMCIFPPTRIKIILTPLYQSIGQRSPILWRMM